MPYLLMAPIAVGLQTMREADKFGVECVRSSDGKFPTGARVVVTNYERLHYFNPDDFGGVGGDESGCLKDADAKTTANVTEFMRTAQYRHLYSATPAPNDWDELGTSAEALGEMGYQDMLTRFFHKQTQRDHLGWGRLTYKMRAYAERDFWRWVCSWARAIRRPSDMGFSDEGYILPELRTHVHEVQSKTSKAGLLFGLPAETVQDQAEERRRTLPERCDRVAELVINRPGPSVCWVNLNPEGDYLERAIPGAVQVSGSDSDERKEEIFAAFAAGQIDKIITKASIAGWGLNWQHCNHLTYFPSHSYESFHQLVHRFHRYGQTRPVDVDIVTTRGGEAMLASIERKRRQADTMFEKLVEHVQDELRISRDRVFGVKTEVPQWLTA